MKDAKAGESELADHVLVKFSADVDHYDLLIPLARVPMRGEVIEFHEYRKPALGLYSPVLFEVVSVIHSVTVSGDDHAELRPVRVHGRRLNLREGLAAEGIKA